MQIFNTPQIPTQTVNPNFKAIKSIKCKGLLEKHPQYGIELVDTLKQNPIALKFFKNIDVDIVFYACKQATSAVESSINIFFNNPAKKKFLGIFGSTRDKISLSHYRDNYNQEDSLRMSVEGLKDYITPNIPGKTSGILDSHIQYKEEEILQELAKKSKKELENINKIKLKEDLNNKLESDKVSLKESIQDIIEKSK